MELIDKINDEYRAMEGYGVTFSIDFDGYEYDGSCDVRFGDNTTEHSGGCLRNYQPIRIDGEVVGYLHEWQRNVLHPMCTQFCRCLSDESEDAKYADDPHYYEGEFGGEMHFANLSDFVAFVNPQLEPLTDEQSEMCDTLVDDYGVDRDEANVLCSEYSGWLSEILSI